MVDVVVRGANHHPIDAELDAATRRKVERFERLASDIRRVEVHFEEARNPRVPDDHRCEIIVHLTGNFVKGHGDATDARTALDRAAEKAEHQLQRVHSKRVTRSKPRSAADSPGA
jgi:ribosomal subunit interface protein